MSKKSKLTPGEGMIGKVKGMQDLALGAVSCISFVLEDF